jgi:uncharacterized protein (DUF1697 family)
MDRLRALCEAVPLRNVETFIASGNVLFDTRSADTAALERRVEKHLERALGHEVLTFVRSADEVTTVAAYEPFGDPAALPRTHMIYVGFLKTAPRDEARDKLEGYRTAFGDLRLRGREIYWRVEKNMRLLGNAALLERILGPATMRNVTTVRKLAQKLAAGRPG